MTVPFRPDPIPSGTRKDDAYAFLVEYIIRWRISPSQEEIAAHLGVSKPRVRDLLAQLEAAGRIQRPFGTQRAILVPGLLARLAVEELRAAGWVIDDDIRLARSARALPHGNLPLVAVIEHRPHDEDQPNR